jgi:hypothetical protein
MLWAKRLPGALAEKGDSRVMYGGLLCNGADYAVRL